MNLHKRKSQNKYKHKILLAAAVASLGVFGAAGTQASTPKAPTKGASQARAKSSAAGVQQHGTIDAQFRDNGNAQAAIGVTQPTNTLLASGYIKDLPGVRYENQSDAEPAGLSSNQVAVLASGYIKDLPGVRFESQVEVARALSTAQLSMLANADLKELPSARFESQVEVARALSTAQLSMLANADLKELPSARFESQVEVAREVSTVQLPMLANADLKELPSARYETVVRDTSDTKPA
jgi:hypothetical protein